MTCDELASFVSVEKHEDWCSFLSQETSSGKSANEACCFCPEGGKLQKTPCEDYTDWSFSGTNGDFGCDFVLNYFTDLDKVCNADEDRILISFNGVTVKEACCVCGGGVRPQAVLKDTSSSYKSPTPAAPTKTPVGTSQPVFQQVPTTPTAPTLNVDDIIDQMPTIPNSESGPTTQRNLKEDLTEEQDAHGRKLSPTDWWQGFDKIRLNAFLNHKQEVMNREGLGESPGIPNIEFLVSRAISAFNYILFHVIIEHSISSNHQSILQFNQGLGYDAYRGNPRGSSLSTTDPGKIKT